MVSASHTRLNEKKLIASYLQQSTGGNLFIYISGAVQKVAEDGTLHTINGRGTQQY